MCEAWPCVRPEDLVEEPRTLMLKVSQVPPQRRWELQIQCSVRSERLVTIPSTVPVPTIWVNIVIEAGTEMNVSRIAGLSSGSDALLHPHSADGGDQGPRPALKPPSARRDPRTGLVVLGAHVLRAPEPAQQVFGVSAVIRHPDYQPATHANDICLLQVSWGGDTGRRSGLSTATSTMA